MTDAIRKVVINACYGGFSLSAYGTQRWAELKGRPCYFLINPRTADGMADFNKHVRVGVEEANEAFMFLAFDVPEYPHTLEGEAWHRASLEERQAANAEYEKHALYSRDIPRDDPELVRVVEEMGEKANGRCANLKVVEIPADVEWEIDEYDGYESIDEKHSSWS